MCGFPSTGYYKFIFHLPIEILKRFLELGSVLEPGKTPKMDKSAIINDAIRMVTELRSESKKLKESNESLQDKIKELKVCFFVSCAVNILLYANFSMRNFISTFISITTSTPYAPLPNCLKFVQSKLPLILQTF